MSLAEAHNCPRLCGWKKLNLYYTALHRKCLLTPALERWRRTGKYHFFSCTRRVLKPTPLNVTSYGASPGVRWLRLYLLMQGVRLQSLVRELRSHDSKYFKINKLNFLDLSLQVLLFSPPDSLDVLFWTLSFFQSSIVLPLKTFDHDSQ